MVITEELKSEIIREVKILKDIYDCVGINLGNNKGLFIQVHDDFGEGKEYLIQLNDIVDGAYEIDEECGYNAFSEFENMDKLIKTIEDYLSTQ